LEDDTMNYKKYLILILIFTITSSLVLGCSPKEENKDGAINPPDKKEITDTSYTYEITLTENATTGYRWHLTNSDDTIIELISDGAIEISSDENLVGAPSKHIWHFELLKEGTAILKFELFRDWENENIIETKIFEIEVKKDPSSEGLNVTSMSEIAAIDLISYSEDDLIIRLDENPTTGFVWHVKFEPDDFELISDEFVSSSQDDSLAGVGGVHSYIFSPKTLGNTTITFELFRDFEKDNIIKTLKYGIEIKENTK